MGIYRMEVGWYTKRQRIADGFQVKAFGPDEAEDYARKIVLKGHPARKIAYIKIEEATEQDIARGYYEA